MLCELEPVSVHSRICRVGPMSVCELAQTLPRCPTWMTGLQWMLGHSVLALSVDTSVRSQTTVRTSTEWQGMWGDPGGPRKRESPTD